MRRSVLYLLTAAFLVGMVHVASATPSKSDSTCWVSPNPVAVGQTYVVSASGLPTGTAINLWVTDPSGNTSGSPLGSTPDGTFNLEESSSSAGTWTYAFSGPVKKHMSPYATCSVDAY